MSSGKISGCSEYVTKLMVAIMGDNNQKMMVVAAGVQTATTIVGNTYILNLCKFHLLSITPPHPQYEPPNYDKGLSLKDAMGNGTLSVARHQPFQKQPFYGTVELVSGEIGQDIAHYLHQSHQIRSLVSLGVYLDQYGKVQAAGGVLIEVMPGVSEAMVEVIQLNYEDFQPNISKMLMDGAQAEDLVKPFMAGIDFHEIPHEHYFEYHCPCTKERVVRALETLGEDELQDMITKNETADVTCQVCGRPYQVTVPEIQEIKDRVHKDSMH
ncbi:MAG: Hsp33 family molecular chaperone HslO [Bdellovibrio sp.]|nr:Hsp33 family molecular chaperone HslO [Bdellovibrio sp.]